MTDYVSLLRHTLTSTHTHSQAHTQLSCLLSLTERPSRTLSERRSEPMSIVHDSDSDSDGSNDFDRAFTFLGVTRVVTSLTR